MSATEHHIGALGGIATLEDLRRVGLSDDAVQRSIGGTVIRVRRGIYATTDAPTDVVRAARVGGALAAASAAPIHEFWVPPATRLHVSVAPDAHALRHPDTGARLRPGSPVRVLRDGHHLDRKAERWVVSPARSLAQAVRLEPSEYAIAMLDSALRARRDDDDRLIRAAHPPTLLDEVRALLPRRLHSVLGMVDRRAESGSESICRVRLARAGIAARPQVPVARGIRVDLLIGDRLAIEVGSFTHHGSRDAYESDRERLATLAMLGVMVLDFSYRQVLFDWPTVLAAVEVTLARGDDQRMLRTR